MSGNMFGFNFFNPPPSGVVFPGWTVSDPNNGVTLADSSVFDTTMTFNNNFQNESQSVVVSLPAAWDNAYGDWNLRFEFGGYDHSASRFLIFGVAAATKDYTGASPSLSTDGDDHAVIGFRGSAAEWIATQAFCNAGISTGMWAGETGAKNRPNVYYGELARESGVIYWRVFDDSGYTTQKGSDGVSNSVGAGFSVDRILIVPFTGGTATNQDGHLKMISVTPNPWS